MANDNSNVTWKTIKAYTDKFKNWIAHNYTNNNNVIEKIKVNGNALTPVDKAVDVKVPTKVSELTDGSDYAKKTDIPTTLPMEGGNADTVNNHTVESDVPENAVFTDTIYDDTEVKGSIEELNNNLNKPAHGFDISFIENGVLVEKRIAQYQKIGNIVFVSMLFKYTTNNLYSRIQLPVIPSRVAPWGMQAQYNDIIGYVEYDYFVLRTPENLWNTEIDFGCGFFYFYDTDAV